MMALLRRTLTLGMLTLLAAGSTRADRADELVRIHTEAIGGLERIKALSAVRATGWVVAGGKRVRFTMTAARPDRVRVETENGGRTLVQASDGKNPPWEFDTGEWPPRYHEVAKEAAKTFAADAEFDDPLVAGAERGFTFDYAGEVKVGNKSLLRLLVTRRLTETFSLLLDPDTFFIVSRVEQKKSPSGQPVRVVTHYGDYRPVDGVLMPHAIGLVVDDQPKQQTRIESIQPNPPLTDETFTRPSAIQVPRR